MSDPNIRRQKGVRGKLPNTRANSEPRMCGRGASQRVFVQMAAAAAAAASIDPRKGEQQDRESAASRPSVSGRRILLSTPARPGMKTSNEQPGLGRRGERDLGETGGWERSTPAPAVRPVAQSRRTPSCKGPIFWPPSANHLWSGPIGRAKETKPAQYVSDRSTLPTFFSCRTAAS